MNVSNAQVTQWLEEVKDPEIPVLSLVDMGVIKNIDINDEQVVVTITPTFVGCPAMDIMKTEIEATLLSKGVKKVIVNVSFEEPWSSDLISEKGKTALKRFGLAPPPQGTFITDLEILEHAECPRCGNTDTELRSPFGATLCRSIHFCPLCKESFEQFKPI
jgi:ring-1,2-phenylacetyl-CoA epoxidase subunit PaaD